MCAYHIFLPFINSGCFYLLPLVENAVMNMDVQMSLWNSAFSSSRYITRSEISGSYGILFLIFWVIAILFPTAAIPFYIPTSCVKQLLFPHILTNTGVLFSIFCLIVAILTGCAMLSHCDFDLYFPNKWSWNFFHVFFGHLCIFFGIMSIQALWLF